jgi:hypothetical protein
MEPRYMTHPTTTPPAEERIPDLAVADAAQTAVERAIAVGTDSTRVTAGQWRPAAALVNPCPASTPVDFAAWLLLDKIVAHCPACRAYTLSTTRGMMPHPPKEASHP